MIRMTPNRRLMLDELQRRNYAPTTVQTYLRILGNFSRHFRRAPDRLGADEIRQYQVHLFRDRRLSARTVAQLRVAVLLRQDAEACLSAGTPADAEGREAPAGGSFP